MDRWNKQANSEITFPNSPTPAVDVSRLSLFGPERDSEEQFLSNPIQLDSNSDKDDYSSRALHQPWL